MKSNDTQIEIIFNKDAINERCAKVSSDYEIETKDIGLKSKLVIVRELLEDNIKIEADGLTEAESMCVLKKAQAKFFYEVAYNIDISQMKESLEGLLFASSEDESSLRAQVSNQINQWHAYVKSIESKEKDKKFEAIAEHLELDMHYTALHYDRATWTYLKKIDKFYSLFRLDSDDIYELSEIYTEAKNEKMCLLDHGMKYIYENRRKIKEVAEKIKEGEKEKNKTEQSKHDMATQNICASNIKLIRSIYRHKDSIDEGRLVIWGVSDILENVWCSSNILMRKYEASAMVGEKPSLLFMPLKWMKGALGMVRRLFNRMRTLSVTDQRAFYCTEKIKELEKTLEKEKYSLEKTKKTQTVKSNRLKEINKEMESKKASREEDLEELRSEKALVEEAIKDLNCKASEGKSWITQILDDIKALEEYKKKNTSALGRLQKRLLNTTAEQNKYLKKHKDRYAQAYGQTLEIFPPAGSAYAGCVKPVAYSYPYNSIYPYTYPYNAYPYNAYPYPYNVQQHKNRIAPNSAQSAHPINHGHVHNTLHLGHHVRAKDSTTAGQHVNASSTANGQRFAQHAHPK
ncbi:hypothetical protein NEMIN01_0247 [Nematocida minor]|uniref:uncharacterized protein n=1 Tax=Nematocida minor TaxID=1912983 RepID=UPI00221F27DC|nr:uncharacterized protein NEMIN01_0247 [Nematocida minor]KAI5188983.1 hypothetical protein NEMIN01_0247 [Nematocida minor]